MKTNEIEALVPSCKKLTELRLCSTYHSIDLTKMDGFNDGTAAENAVISFRPFELLFFNMKKKIITLEHSIMPTGILKLDMCGPKTFPSLDSV